MLKLGALIVVAALTANAPLVTPMSSRDTPQIANQQTEQATAAQQGSEGAYQKLGGAPASPLYVEAACEHGCGYAEDNKNFLQKLWTDPIATFTGVLAILTLGLIGVGISQGRLISRQITLAQSEFAAAYPPELVMRDVRWDSIEEGEAAIAFTLINKGRHPCEIVESIFRYRSDFNHREVFETDGVNELPMSFAPGEFKFITSAMISEGEKVAAEAAKMAILAKHYFRGVIIYEDRTKIRRRMVFARVCLPHAMHFGPSDEPGSDYTD
jgi:hypothetical protein